LAGIAVFVLWQAMQMPAGPVYLTQPVMRGELVASVTATGTLQPLNQVEVGSEQSGTVARVEVDDNDRVSRGQLLAQLDESRLRDQIARSDAALAVARAQLEQAEATLQEAAATVRRVRDMRQASLVADADLDAAEASYERARAARTVAFAYVRQAEAGLSADRTSLDRASIRSPIDGVVLSRRIMPGQTVAASLQAPVLFVLAENLAEMKLELDVSEADVAEVREGQGATFRVDAYPLREFQAEVTRVGLGSQVKDNVVSYLTVLRVGNADLSLRPGMTATAQITTLRREDALLVPNAALRFTPAAQQAPARGLLSQLMPRMPRPLAQRSGARASGDRSLWVLDGETLVEVRVGLGASDGRVSEILSGDLHAGDLVVTGARSASP
jgi:HlyD family secretion protein